MKTYINNAIKTMVTILLTFCFLSCNNLSKNSSNNNVIISPKLNYLLDDYIKKHSNNSNNKVYVLYFDKDQTNHYVTIYQSYFYDKKYISGYFFKNNNLVIFYFLDIAANDSLVNRSKIIQYNNSIPDYIESSKYDGEFETYPQKYKIVSPDSLELISETNSIHEEL